MRASLKRKNKEKNYSKRHGKSSGLAVDDPTGPCKIRGIGRAYLVKISLKIQLQLPNYLFIPSPAMRHIHTAMMQARYKTFLFISFNIQRAIRFFSGKFIVKYCKKIRDKLIRAILSHSFY